MKAVRYRNSFCGMVTALVQRHDAGFYEVIYMDNRFMERSIRIHIMPLYESKSWVAISPNEMTTVAIAERMLIWGRNNFIEQAAKERLEGIIRGDAAKESFMEGVDRERAAEEFELTPSPKGYDGYDEDGRRMKP